MIGQVKLRETFDKLYESGEFPHFSVLIGEDGMGKKTFMKEFSHKWLFVYEAPDVKVDTIRKVIDFSRKISDKYLFLIPDIHKMSIQAKNSLLKLCEEPPKNAYFLMSVNSKESLLATLMSRAAAFTMDRYSKDELMEAIGSRQNSLDSDFICNSFDSIAEVNYALEVDFGAVWKHCDILLKKANKLSLANLIKSKGLMKFKDSDEGYDLKFFVKVMIGQCLSMLEFTSNNEDTGKWSDIVDACTIVLDRLNVKAINKQMLYEELLFRLVEIEDLYEE